MGALIQNGVDWILAIQSLGSWLEYPMKFFTSLGSENFFFLVLPLVYWSVDARLGLRIAFILVTGTSLSCIAKFLFASPRPYWVSADVKPGSVESSFGLPSTHAQNAAALWGTLAAGVPAWKRWAWVAAVVLAFLVGFSRLYLGMHFVHDVLVGWLIGYALLFVFLKCWDPVAAWLKTKTFLQQVAIAFAFSLALIVAGLLSNAPLNGYTFPAAWTENALRAGPLPEPASIETIFTAAGSFFGFALGAAWIASRGGYQADGPLAKRALRYAIGLIGVLILWEGLGAVLPRGETWLPLTLRYLRYTLVGFWMIGGAPGLFFHFNLARKPNM
ncbi:MAG TPA: phosphatase PAP2 family protein [Anaerolineales bacterium]|nr:phosphatase PAP2 family protein [Anaerolineales bacterium]